MYTHARYIRKHNSLQALQQKNATSTTSKKRFHPKSPKMRAMQKPNHPSRRLKRIRKLPKSPENTIQSQTQIRWKFLRCINPKRNNRLHERTRKTNGQHGKFMHGGTRKSFLKF